MNVRVRGMELRDYPEVLAIDDESYDVPLGRNDLTQTLRANAVTGLVAEARDGGAVVGFMIYGQAKGGGFEVTRLAVARAARGSASNRPVAAAGHFILQTGRLSCAPKSTAGGGNGSG